MPTISLGEISVTIVLGRDDQKLVKNKFLDGGGCNNRSCSVVMHPAAKSIKTTLLNRLKNKTYKKLVKI